MQEILDRKTERDEIISFLEENFDVENISKKEFLFLIEFVTSGKAYKSYQKVYGSHIKMNSAAVLASRILKKHNISFVQWLEYAGHGTDSITEALDYLKKNDRDAYLKHATKLKQLDVQKVEHSGSIDIPQLNVTFFSKDKDA